MLLLWWRRVGRGADGPSLNARLNLAAAEAMNDRGIYLGRRFKNDTERLEKLFELYTKMATAAAKKAPARKKAARKMT